MSFTALHKPALRVVVQAVRTLTLPQKVKIIKAISACLSVLIYRRCKQWLHFYLIRHRRKHFLNA